MRMISAVLATGLLIASNINAKASFGTHNEVKQFIQHMNKKHSFPEKELDLLFQKVSPNQNVITKIKTPYEALPWDKYKNIFLSEKRISNGVIFIKENKEILERSQAKFGVPKSIITAIIGVESFYGKNKGSFPVLQTLSTLGFNYKPRSKFFLAELEEYLVLCRDHKLEPTNLKGSYAGAMGFPQFISSSYRNFAYSFNNKNNVDLINNIDDAIASVANYFKRHGWKKNEIVIQKVKLNGNKYTELVKKDKSNPKPQYNQEKLAKFGIIPNVNSKKNWSFLEFKGSKNNEYMVGADNFYTITRYNHSNNYAYAAYLLSEEIEKAYNTNITKS